MPRWKQERNRKRNPRIQEPSRDMGGIYVAPHYTPHAHLTYVAPGRSIPVAAGTKIGKIGTTGPPQLTTPSMRVIGRGLGEVLRQYGLHSPAVEVRGDGRVTTFHVEFAVVANEQTAALMQAVRDGR